MSSAWDRVYALLYAELRQIAISLIRQQYRGFAISPTSLVSETWIKLAGRIERQRQVPSRGAHRARHAVRAGGSRAPRPCREARDGLRILSLEDSPDVGGDNRFEQLLILDNALNALAQLDQRMARVVEMRYFGGMSLEEIAGTLQVTERTVGRDWRKARAFLYSMLADEEVALPP